MGSNCVHLKKKEIAFETSWCVLRRRRKSSCLLVMCFNLLYCHEILWYTHHVLFSVLAVACDHVCWNSLGRAHWPSSGGQINGSQLWRGKTDEKRVLVPFRLPQIPVGLPWERYRVATTGRPSISRNVQFISRDRTVECASMRLRLFQWRKLETGYLWNVAPCSSMDGHHRCFERICCPICRVV